MFKGSTGTVSSMRICMFLVVATICGIYIAQNIVSMVHGHGLIALGLYEFSTLVAIFGAKIGQNITENMSGPVPASPAILPGQVVNPDQ